MIFNSYEAPRMQSLHKEYHGEYFLTHCKWFNGWGGSNETGVRRGDEFKLIQHDYDDWRRAADIIKRGLDKGWSVNKITDVLERVK